MVLVGGVPPEHAILRNQPAPALGQEHLVAELHWFQHLPPLDQIGVGFENGVQFLPRWYLLAVQDTTPRLIDDTGGEVAVARDLTAEGVDSGLRDEIQTTH